jgi:hypothetical protein
MPNATIPRELFDGHRLPLRDTTINVEGQARQVFDTDDTYARLCPPGGRDIKM